MSSSRSNSHASIDGHDEPLLPFGTGFDKPRGAFRLRLRSMLSRGFVKRVLIAAVAVLFILAILLYRHMPVSISGAATHPQNHQDPPRPPGAGPESGAKGGDEKVGQEVALVQATPDSTSAAGPDATSAGATSAGATDGGGGASQTQDAIVVVVPGTTDLPKQQEKEDDDDDDDDDDDGADVSFGDVTEPNGAGADGDYEDEDEDEDERYLSPEELEAKKAYQDDLKGMPWLRFKQSVNPPLSAPSGECRRAPGADTLRPLAVSTATSTA